MSADLLRRLPLAALAVALAAACGEQNRLLEPGFDDLAGPAFTNTSLPPGAALLLETALTIETVEPGSIREIREIAALFVQNPIGEGGPMDLEVRVELAPAAGVQPQWIIAVQGAAWIDWGDGYKLDVSGPNDVPAVIQLLRVEDGQVEDFTGLLASTAGKLRFLPNAKAWSLSLELTGILLPVDQIAREGIGGAVEGALKIGETLVPAVIREAEAEFQGDALHLTIGSAIEQLDGGGLREQVESAYHFTGLEPLDGNGSPIDLRILYQLGPTGGVIPCYQRFIPAEAWQPDGTGGFKFQASGPNLPAVFQIMKGADGQLTDDLTDHIETVQARLWFDAVAKAWLLEIELTSDDVIAPMFHPMLGAQTVTLDGGESLLPAGLREAQARFF